MNEWQTGQPRGYGFYWTWDGLVIGLGCWTGTQFQCPYTVGDREGLYEEFMPGVTHWRELLEPSPPPQG